MACHCMDQGRISSILIKVRWSRMASYEDRSLPTVACFNMFTEYMYACTLLSFSNSVKLFISTEWLILNELLAAKAFSNIIFRGRNLDLQLTSTAP